MSVRSEVVQGLKQFTDRSAELMRVVRSISTGEGSAEAPESVMKLIIQTDSALQASVARCTSIMRLTDWFGQPILTYFAWCPFHVFSARKPTVSV